MTDESFPEPVETPDLRDWIALVPPDVPERPPATRITPAEAEWPRQIGAMAILDKIGQGGMGVVLRARDSDFSRVLAVKVLPLAFVHDADLKRRFLEEAQVMAQLQHPGIPPVHHRGELPDGRPYYSMKLIQGKTLAELLPREARDTHAAAATIVGDGERHGQGTSGAFLGAADLAHFLGIFEQVCQTMAYAHSRRILHRDLKPSNIMVGAFGEVQVMDWGLAKVLKEPPAVSRPADALGGGEAGVDAPASAPGGATAETEATHAAGTDSDASETEAGRAMGTPAFMPPEQAVGATGELDERCDVFALGAILGVLLTGRPPYSGASAYEVLRAAAAGDLGDAFARLDACGADVDLVALARRCLAPRKEDRPAHAGVVAEALASYQRQVRERLRDAEIERAQAQTKAEEEIKRRAVEEAKTREERRRRRVTLALAVALLTLVAGLAAGALWYQADRARQERDELERAALEKERAVEKQARHLAREEGIREALDATLATQTILRKRLEQNGGVFSLLNRTAEWQLRLKEAGAALRRAKDLAAGSEAPLDPALVRGISEATTRLSADDADMRMALRLEKIHLDHVSLGARTTREAALAAGEAALRDAGLKLTLGAEKEDVARIGASPIGERLLQAVDDLAILTYQVGPKERMKLFQEIAALADTNPSHQLIRKADIKSLTGIAARLLAEERLKEMSAVMIGTAGRLLEEPALRDRWWRKAQLLMPDNYGVNQEMVVALVEQKNFRDALGVARAGVAIRPRGEHAWFNLGWLLTRTNDLEGAADAYRTALEIDPDYAGAWNNLGIVLHSRRDLPSAVTAYRKAVRGDATSADAYGNLGDALRESNDRAGAIDAYRHAVKLNAKDAESWYWLGNLLLELDPGEAPAALERALALDPRKAETHRDLALAYRNQAQFDKAIQMTEIALARLKLKDTDKGALAKLLADLKQQQALDRRLPEVLKGEDADGETLTALADICFRFERRYADSARLYARARTAAPKLFEGPRSVWRYLSAQAAAMAAADRTQADGERSVFRKQALAMLEAELAVLSQAAKVAPPLELLDLEQKLAGWSAETRLASVRDLKAIEEMPAKEGAEWRRLWAHASVVSRSIQAAYVTTNLSGVLTIPEKQKWHQLELQAGRTYVVDLGSEFFEARLMLEKAKERVVETGTARRNPRLFFTPPENGACRLVIAGTGAGPYTLTVREFNNAK